MKEGKAYKYAVWCSTEQEGKVPEYVKKQAESWLHIADGNDEDAYVDEQEYEKICKLLKLMVHPDLRCSIYDGLEDYAWFMIVAGLCTYCRNSEQRSRFYVTILLEIARKNFKTFNSAVIFILLMLTEPDFSRFFSVAPDLQLSSELKNAIRKIIKVSPALYDEDEPAFKVLRSQIICLLNENEYTPLAYSQDGMDGKLANAYLADEAGALDDYPVEAMRSSQITLFNKLGRGVTSLTTLTGKQSPWKKIRVVETMDMINNDIVELAEDNYIGKYQNTYSNKCLLLSAIKTYMDEILVNGLIEDYSIEFDVEKIRKYVIENEKIKKEDAEAMSDEEMQKQYTDEKVYFKATVTISDVMEDIYLDITA